MKLDRNNSHEGLGKYIVTNLRKVEGTPRTPMEVAAAILKNPECVEFGRVGEDDEFWLMNLKDLSAKPAIQAYAEAASKDDPEYGAEVMELTNRSGLNSPFCKFPD